MWANWYISQWDSYILYDQCAINHPFTLSLKDPHIVFRENNQLAYTRYRELMQILDVSLLDAKSMQYLPRTIMAASLYIILAYHCGQATKEQIATELSKTSQFLDLRFPFNNLYEDFLMKSFGFQLEELLPTIQYISEFMGLPFCYNVPDKLNEIIDVRISFI